MTKDRREAADPASRRAHLLQHALLSGQGAAGTRADARSHADPASRRAHLLQHLRRVHPRPALTFGPPEAPQTLTYADLWDAAARYATGLSSLGVRPGDRVAVYLPTTPALAIATLGHALLGTIHVPINPHYTPAEAAHILLDSGACALLTDPPSAQRLDAYSPPLPSLTRVLTQAHTPSNATSFDQLIRQHLPIEGVDHVTDEDIALLIYTSGTTGRSKGVAHTFGSWLGNIAALTTLWRWSGDDVLSLSLPLFHIHGLGLGLYGAWWHGAHVLAHPRFDAAAVVDDFARRGATVFMGVPTMYRLLIERLEAHPAEAAALRRGRLWTAGSAPLPAADHARFASLTGHAVLERYGMSETMLTLSNPYAGERRPGAVGLPVPGGALEVVDEAGRPLPDGEAGELRYRGEALMRGYWPAQTPPLDQEGWFRTGDIAVRSADGYFQIIGRASLDLIKTGGYKVSAREVEDALLGTGLVSEAAVVGVPDPKWGQRVEAVIVPSAEGAATRDLTDALTRACAARLTDYKRPRALHVRAALPRNALGKVQKNLIIKDMTGA